MIRYLKLASGHEIVGEEVDSNGMSYTLRKPMVIEMIDHGGHVMCSLVTYCVATDIVEFNARYVLQTGSASESFIETYNRRQQMSSEVFQAPQETSDDPFFEGESDEEDDEELMDSVFERIKPTYH